MWTVHDLFGKVQAFFYMTGAAIVYSVPERDLESPWLLDVNRGNSHISLVIFQDILITFVDFIFPIATKSSVCIR